MFAQSLLNIELAKPNASLTEDSTTDPSEQYFEDDDENIQGATTSKGTGYDEGLWSEKETLLLISCYGEHVEDFAKAKKRKYVWDIISEKMSAQNYHLGTYKYK